MNPGPHGPESCWRRVLECPGGSAEVRLNSNCRALVSVCVLREPSGARNLCPGCAPALRSEQQQGDGVEGSLDGTDLGEDVDAVAILVHHLLDTAYLTLNPVRFENHIKARRTGRGLVSGVR